MTEQTKPLASFGKRDDFAALDEGIAEALQQPLTASPSRMTGSPVASLQAPPIAQINPAPQPAVTKPAPAVSTQPQPQAQPVRPQPVAQVTKPPVATATPTAVTRLPTATEAKVAFGKYEGLSRASAVDKEVEKSRTSVSAHFENMIAQSHKNIAAIEEAIERTNAQYRVDRDELSGDYQKRFDNLDAQMLALQNQIDQLQIRRNEEMQNLNDKQGATYDAYEAESTQLGTMLQAEKLSLATLQK